MRSTRRKRGVGGSRWTVRYAPRNEIRGLFLMEMRNATIQVSCKVNIREKGRVQENS